METGLRDSETEKADGFPPSAYYSFLLQHTMAYANQLEMSVATERITKKLGNTMEAEAERQEKDVEEVRRWDTFP
jgi:hypothetical protein